jgi:exo-beta-1,3-glucanase (GH17 family)
VINHTSLQVFSVSRGAARIALLPVLPLLLGLVLLLTTAYFNARAKPLADAQLPAGQTSLQLPCVSYAPFRRPGATPFDPRRAVSAAEIEDDLRRLQPRLQPLTQCIRTYGVGNGLDAVPGIAQKLGFRVHQGVWLAGDAAANQRELDTALALAQRYPQTVVQLVVGNEVLLRRDLSPEQLGAILQQAKRRANVPITYADVWEFWVRHAALAAHVDSVTIHILPYWEDEPVAVEYAVDHVYSIARQVAAKFPGKRLWIGETGWPTQGRQRAGAVPGQYEQTRFVREMVSRSAREPLDFNLIEAFDQPWKRQLEGAMGGHWGVIDAAGKGKVTLTGVVPEDAHLMGVFKQTVFSAVFAMCLVGLLAWRFLAAAGRLAFGSCAGLVAACSVLHWHFMGLWNLTSLDAFTGSVALVCGALTALIVVWASVYATAFSREASRPSRTDAAAAFLITLALLIAASHALLVLMDGRYRGFSWALYLAPTAALVTAWLYGWRVRRFANETRFLSLALAGTALSMGISEGIHNCQAWQLASLWLLLAAVAFACASGAQPRERVQP